MKIIPETIQDKLINLALKFVLESQKTKCFFEDYIETDLTILREHKIDYAENQYNQYINLQCELTSSSIKRAFNIGDYNRNRKRSSDEFLKALDDMNDAIVAYKDNSIITVCSTVTNKQGREYIIGLVDIFSTKLLLDYKKTKQMSLAIKVKSEIFEGLYFFINFERTGCFRVEFGMFEPRFSIDIGSLFSTRSYFVFDTIEELHDCADKALNLIISVLPYLEEVFKESLEN